ncbi:MAG TPA: hypothetical protein VJH34_01555, partial [archaeon]|nr:hypothetical protein [archaeon]
GAASATLAVGTDVSNAVYEASSTIASAVSTTCPTYSIEHVREKCTAYGGTLSYIKDSHGCEYPQCSFKETLKEVGTKTCPYYVVGIDEMKEKCLKYGGRFLLNTDESNCPVPKCDIQSTSTAIATPEHVAGKCFEVSDPSTNITRVVCPQTSCPAIPTDISKRCIEHNGTIVEKKDPYGCAYVACQFQNTVTSVSTNSFTGLERCPTAGEIELTLQKCQGAGLRGVVSLVGGCKVPVCSPGETKTCSGLTEETVKRVENECISKGLNAVKAHDLNGCPVYKCEESRCVKTLSQEAYDKCQSLGGEMITKRDESGCVSYSNCLTRGDERFSYTEPIKEVPDQTVLLDISLKLEQLKIKINQFTAQAEEIQKYYESSNSPEAERYKRVIGMFGGLVDKIDEIRLKLGGASLTTDGIFEIKHDIRYLKDVMLKDIVYVMLSESSDVTEIEKGEVGECSKDGNCFDASFRICKQITFEPDGQYGPVIEIKGMEGDRCVIKVEMSPERMPVGSSVKITEKMDMTCKIPNFALGIKKPQDMLRYCEGKMVDFAKGLGGIAYASGKEFPPAEGGPGGCKTIKECSTYCYNNYDSCVQWTKEHPAYGSPPPKEELKRIIDSST